ncbi:hypothetical protein [Streptomyces sp. NPDC047042]|uniref:hypothetical protein n=1 Tax=Streptomyces sp. NPDC047042 TaxID=3154807 RepID=UPI0033FC2146
MPPPTRVLDALDGTFRNEIDEAASPVDALGNVWREWAEDNGVRPGTKQVFGRNLLSIVPLLNRTHPRDPYGRQVVAYNGITR